MKKTILLMMVIGMAAGVSSAALTWDCQWNANEYPEEFQDGTVFTYTNYGTAITRWMDTSSGDSMVKFDANPGTEGFDYSTQASAWTDADSTIDFTYKTLAWRDDKNSTIQFRITSAARDWVSGFVFSKDETSSFIQDIATSTIKVRHSHVSGTGIYRILYYAEGDNAGNCNLYYDDGDGEWEFLLTSYGYSQTQTTDALSVRDPSSSYAGAYSISKQYWTNQGATLENIVPEPCSVALLGVGGLFSLIRRKM